MSKFNGLTPIELEMLKDEIAKSLPGVLAMVPSFAQIVAAHYEAFKTLGFTGTDAIQLAATAAARQIGL
jgi:hypothetical protein